MTLSGGSLELLMETGTTDQTVLISAFSDQLSVSGTYTVQEGDESGNLAVSSVALGTGATLVDAAGNAPANLQIPTSANLSDNSSIVIDGVRPTISSITSSSTDGDYQIGDDISFTITFSEAVTLSAGNLQVTFETGTTDRTVNISSISGTTATGTYTVQAGDESSDLTVASVTVAGGSLLDANLNEMTDFSIPSGQNIADGSSIVVDGIVPTSDQVGSITSVGGNVQSGYWNSTNTSIEVTVPLDNADNSLVGGTIQLTAKVDANSYANLGTAATITSTDVSTGLKSISITAGDLEALTGFSDDGQVTVTAEVSDKAGNSVTYTASATTLTIDQTIPSYSSITSTDISGTYNIGDTINITVNFTEAVSLDQGDLQINMNTGQTVTIPEADLVNAIAVSGTYTVQSGDETSALEVNTLDVTTGGQVLDAAGNPMTLSVLVVSNDLSATKTIIIDGIAPTQYTLGDVTTTGGTVVAGYWNNSNTGISVVIPLNVSDASLDDGSVQLKGKLTTASSYTAIGSATLIVNSDRTAGTMTVTATDADLGGLLTDGETIEFIATITDAPGNTTDYITSAITLIVDLTDPANQTVGAVTATGGTVVADYWNGTNDGISVTVPIDGTDNSLVGGSVYLQAVSGTGSSFDTVGVAFSIANSDLIAGSKTLTASATGTAATDLKEIATWSDGNSLRFRAVIYDMAGNSQVFTESNTTLLIDETVPTVINVFSTSGDGAYMEDDTVDIYIRTSEDVTVATGTPQLTLETGTQDAIVSYDSGSGSDSLKFRYVVAFGQSSSDLDYASNTALSLAGSTIRDAAGNDMTLTLPDPGGSGSLSSNNDIVIDTQIPAAVISLDPDSLYREGEVVNIIVNFDESMDLTPVVQVDFAGGTVEGPYSMVQSGNDSTWTKSITIPAGNDGVATITVTGNDLAGNALTNGNTTGRQLLRVDNTAPTLSSLSPADNAYVNHTRVNYVISETVASGSVTWVRTAGSGDPDSHVATLDGNQLIGGFTYQEIDLTPVPPLVDGTIYTMTFSVTDSAGNTSPDYNITNVVYDTTRPTVTYTYSDTVVNGGTNVTITGQFNESITATPLLTVNYAGTDDLTDAPLSVVAGTDSTQWEITVIIPTGEGNNGYANLTVNASDRAGNTLLFTGQTDAGIMLVDNSQPTVSFAYANLTQPGLGNRGKAGDVIRITATFDDRMITPTLNIQYADTLITGLLHNGTNPSDSVWIYDVTLPADSANTGTFIISTDSTDFAGNTVATYTDNDIFELDNIPPAGFTTGEILPIATNGVPTWINESTTALQINIPVASATNDPTMIDGGIVIEMYNLTRGTDYRIVADTTAITQGGTNIVTRSVANIISAIDLQEGDRIRTRALLYDRVGNLTVGDTSSIIFRYDVDPPVYNGLLIEYVDTLYSSDHFSGQWNGRFTETDPDVESGLDYYEIAMDTETAADTIGFMNWLSTGASTSIDTLLPLSHQTNYRLYLRSHDIAGNISDIVQFDTTWTRLNTSPIISPMDSVGHYEDLPYSDTITVTDADLSTLLGDEFRYGVTTMRLLDSSIVSGISVDSLTGVLTWTPSQADTGRYQVAIRVNDAWGFSDTLHYNFTVTAVNDTPTVAILPPDDNITFAEDHTDTIRINLTQYAHDVDNDSTTLAWQAVILDTTDKPGFPLGRVIIGPGTPYSFKTFLTDRFGVRNSGLDKKAHLVSSFIEQQAESFTNKISISIDTLNGITYATFDSDSNYYGSDHRIIFYATDPSGAFNQDTILLTILPENDPPTWMTVENQFIYENDSLKLDVTEFVSDVDDSLLTFTVTAMTNIDKLTIIPSQFTATTTGDSVVFRPQPLWSDSARIQVIVNDGQAADTVQFTIDIIRVKRPHLSIAVIQNNAFTNYFNIIVTDSVQKTTSLSLTVQQQIIPLDTIAHYTYSGTHNFDQGGTYQFDAYAVGVVGDTTVSRQVGLTMARSGGRWSGSSPDGNFRLTGEPGAVGFDQAILVIDSSLFVPTFNDKASYLIGNEDMVFDKPILVSFRSGSEHLAIYRRDIGYDWVELPSINNDEKMIIAYTDRMGYYRLGPKTIYVPGKTNLVNNYPNPFNPYTTIQYDIGFQDGPEQNINISVFNIRGQHIATLFSGPQSIGRHTVSWNARDDNGSSMATGMYFIHLTTNAGVAKTKKVMLIR
ncbi:MAG: T9SS type A sorting domain-containing protein [Fidelibacterota bacterium]